MDYSGKQKGVGYDMINKSLDELVSEDQSMRHGKSSHYKRGAASAAQDKDSDFSG